MATEPTGQLTLAGDDEILWVVSGEWNQEREQFLQHLRYRPTSAQRLLAPTNVSTQIGEIRRAAVVAGRLHLFFRGDGRGSAHYSYDWSGGQRELQLPDGVIPEALAGERSSRGPTLWAIVSAKTADAVEAQWRRLEQERLLASGARTETAPAETQMAPLFQEPTNARAAGTYHLVQYDGSDWKPGFELTTEYVAGERTWLSVAGDRCHLLWQPSSGNASIQHAWRERERWTQEPPLDVGAPTRTGVARLVREGEELVLLFATLSKESADSHLLRCRTWQWLAEKNDTFKRGWSALPVPRSSRDEEVRVPPGAVMASFEDAAEERKRSQAWAILSWSDKGVELGVWSLRQGVPIQPEMAVVADEREDGSQERQNVREMVGLAIVFVLLMLVFWRRQDNLAQLILLPPGYAVAPLSKRAAAFLIDLLPAAGLVWWIWHDDLMAYSKEINDLLTLGIQQPPDVPVKFLWIWFYFRLIYTGYCMLFELINFSTPGKRLMGCEILSESLKKPSPLQVIIRNLSRILELEMYLLVAWPFLLVVFFTRNRQRFGDLIAKTMVVERQQVLSDTPGGLDESDHED